MRRPHWRSAMFSAVSGAVGLAVLAGCATREPGLSAYDQTARYLQNARGRYVIPGPPSDPWGPYIREASKRYDMPESWIRALMHQESGGQLYRGGRLITSSAGAMGLMQVMPGTYAELRTRHRLGPDPFDPHDNIMAGVAYMREMYDMYGSPGFLAAYNAGPNRLDDYLANLRPLPDETRHYVAAIGPALRYAEPHNISPAQQFAMNQLPLNIPPGPRFGYGEQPMVQLASNTSWHPPVFTQAVAQPTYTPPIQPRAVAWAQPPAPVYRPAPASQPSALAWNEPPRPAYRPAPAAQPPALAWNEPPRPTYTTAPAAAYSPQRTVVARAESDDAEETPIHRITHPFTHHTEPTRVALAIPPVPPQHSGGGWHFISAAAAAEVYTVHRGRKGGVTRVSYTRETAHGHEHHEAEHHETWKLHASGPVQARPVCHKVHAKMVCGAG